VSPDGSTLAASGLSPGISLYPIDGGGSQEVPGTSDIDVPIGWIRDGLLVARLGSPAFPRGAIYRVDVGTGRQEPWANILPSDAAGIMVLARFRVTPDGRSRASSWHRALSTLYVADDLA
jgi:hypothetical protein